MKIYRKLTQPVMVILLALIAALLATMMLTSRQAKAATITINGLDANDAKITDIAGNDLEPGAELDKYTSYKVNYDWSIPDGVKINNGDTATFAIPDNVAITSDTFFPITDEFGTTIGEVTIKQGEKTGTIVFNDALAATSAGRHGTLYYFANGTVDNNTNNNHWYINKVGTLVPTTIRLEQKQIRWNIALNIADMNLKDVVVTDTLGPNQTFVPGSVVVNRMQNGNYLGSITPEVTVNGNVITMNLGDVDDYLDIYYTTTTNGNNDYYQNSVFVEIDGVTHSASDDVAVGGGGTGTSYVGSALLQKSDFNSQAAIAGAHYQVLDQTGKVIYEDLVTDEQGQIRIDRLAPGNYSFVETQAPAGYLLNPTPLPFVIIPGVSEPVLVQADDRPIAQTDILVKKIWQNVPAGTSTPPITAVLYRNDQRTEQTVILNSANNYQATFANLPVTDSLGTPINYTVAEVDTPAGYESLTPGEQKPDNGLVTLIDRYIVKEPTKPTTPTTPKPEPEPTKPLTPTKPAVKPAAPSKPVAKPMINKPTVTSNKLPQTGEKKTTGIWTAVGLLVILLLAGLWIKRRSANK